MFKIKDRAAASVPVVIILMLIGVVAGIINYNVGLNVSDKAIEGSYDAYETLTGTHMERPKVGPVGAYPKGDGTDKFADKYFDNFYYEDAAKNHITSESEAIVNVKQTEKKKNSYQVSLKYVSPIDLRTVKISPDAAVVIVVDTSGSMQYGLDGGGWCNNPSCSSYQKYSKTHTWQHRWSINPTTGENTTRFKYAADGLKEFLNDFEDQSQGKRLVSVVYFGENAEYKLDWVDLNEPGNLQKALDITSYSALSARPRTNTAQGTGLEAAGVMLQDPILEGVKHKYVMLLTDGRPENKPADNKTSVADNETGAHGTAMARMLEETYGAKVQVVGFATDGLNLKQGGKKVDAWLRDDVATTPEDFYSATNFSELSYGLNKLQQKISAGATLFTVTAPMGECINYNGLASESVTAKVNGDVLTWNLLEETPTMVVQPDGSVVYEYILTYNVSLDINDPDFDYGKFYPVHGDTNITYVDVAPDGSIDPDAEITLVPLAVPEIYTAKSS